MPLNPTLLRAFYFEIKTQCGFALVAADGIGLALQTPDVERIFYSIQAFLVATANLSKILWPSHPAIPSRGAQLRSNLGVSNTSPLKLRDLRNDFEHYDERLEQWARSSTRHNLADMNIDSGRRIQGLDPGDYMRNFNPTNYNVSFRGISYDLRPVIAEVDTLLRRVTAEINRL